MMERHLFLQVAMVWGQLSPSGTNDIGAPIPPPQVTVMLASSTQFTHLSITALGSSDIKAPILLR